MSVDVGTSNNSFDGLAPPTDVPMGVQHIRLIPITFLNSTHFWLIAVTCCLDHPSKIYNTLGWLTPISGTTLLFLVSSSLLVAAEEVANSNGYDNKDQNLHRLTHKLTRAKLCVDMTTRTGPQWALSRCNSRFFAQGPSSESGMCPRLTRAGGMSAHLGLQVLRLR